MKTNTEAVDLSSELADAISNDSMAQNALKHILDDNNIPHQNENLVEVKGQQNEMLKTTTNFLTFKKWRIHEAIEMLVKSSRISLGVLNL